MFATFKPKLRHNAPTLMLGRVVVTKNNNWYGAATIEIDIGGGLPHSFVDPYHVEVANGFDKEFEQQIADYDQFLMLSMFEW